MLQPPLPEPHELSRRIRGDVLGVSAALFLFPALLVINCIQTLSVVLLPLSRKTFRGINRTLAGLWWSCCAKWVRRFYGVRVEITGDDVPRDEQVIVLCNHQTMTDIPVLFELALRKGRLGDLKWYVKDILKYVPGIGWGMLFLDCLFIKRNWTADKEKIRRTFKRIVSDRVPVWIVSFAEGTRITPAKIERSTTYAAGRDLPILKNVLMPRTKGFVATLRGLDGHLDAVLDCTIGYHGGIPTLSQWFKGYVPRVSFHVRRFPVEDLPRDDEGRANWIVARYAEKDALLDDFLESRSFPGGPS